MRVAPPCAERGAQSSRRARAVASGPSASCARTADAAAQKAEERGEGVAVAREIATAEEAGGVPAPMIALSLDGLEARYSWIKEFTSEGADIYLIASKFFIKRVVPKTPP